MSKPLVTAYFVSVNVMFQFDVLLKNNFYVPNQLISNATTAFAVFIFRNIEMFFPFEQ